VIELVALSRIGGHNGICVHYTQSDAEVSRGSGAYDSEIIILDADLDVIFT
jgi:hypothetical protein